jgi:DNA-binding MarR family transcriptional regulator
LGANVYTSGVAADEEMSWTFLTNHAHVLLCIRRNSEIRLRDVAELVGITERAAQKIVSDLAEAGYVKVERVGRRNRYTIHPRRPLRHRLEHSHVIDELLDVLEDDGSTRRRPSRS